MVHQRGDRGRGHHVLRIVLHCDSGKVGVGTGWVEGADALLVDLRVLGQTGEERVQFLLVELGDRFCRKDAWVFRQNVEVIFEGWDCFNFVLPVIFDSFKLLVVDVDESGDELFILVKCIF